MPRGFSEIGGWDHLLIAPQNIRPLAPQSNLLAPTSRLSHPLRSVSVSVSVSVCEERRYEQNTSPSFTTTTTTTITVTIQSAGFTYSLKPAPNYSCPKANKGFVWSTRLSYTPNRESLKPLQRLPLSAISSADDDK